MYKRQEFIDFDAGRQDIIWAKKVNQFLDHAEDSLPLSTAVPQTRNCPHKVELSQSCTIFSYLLSLLFMINGVISD